MRNRKAIAALAAMVWMGLAVALDTVPSARAGGLDDALKQVGRTVVGRALDAAYQQISGENEKPSARRPGQQVRDIREREFTIVILPTEDYRARDVVFWNPSRWGGEVFVIRDGNISGIMSTALSTQLTATGGWYVLPLEMVREVNELQDVLADPERFRPDTVVRRRERFSAQRGLKTRVTHLVAKEFVKGDIPLDVPFLGDLKVGVEYTLFSLRMEVWLFDLEKGVLQSAFTVVGEEIVRGFRIQKGNFFWRSEAEWRQTPVGQAIEDAAHKAAAIVTREDLGPLQVETHPLTVRRVNPESGKIFLDGRGSAAQVGDRFIVPIGPPMYDENRILLGYEDELIVRVVQVKANLLECEPVARPRVWPKEGIIAEPIGGQKQTAATIDDNSEETSGIIKPSSWAERLRTATVGEVWPEVAGDGDLSGGNEIIIAEPRVGESSGSLEVTAPNSLAPMLVEPRRFPQAARGWPKGLVVVCGQIGRPASHKAVYFGPLGGEEDRLAVWVFPGAAREIAAGLKAGWVFNAPPSTEAQKEGER